MYKERSQCTFEEQNTQKELGFKEVKEPNDWRKKDIFPVSQLQITDRLLQGDFIK